MSITKKMIGFILGISVLVGSLACYCIFQKKPKISVILPTYNREDMLPRALDSILQQTFTDFELIVINDGSADKTQEILEEYAAKDQRIKIIKHEQNKGLVAGLNEGLERAKGEYIARMDDDDVSYPKRLEKQLAYMEAHPEYAAVGVWGGPFNDNRVYLSWKQTDSEYIKILTLLGLTPMAHSSLMMRTSFLKEHQIRYKPAYKSAEDLPLLADLMIAGSKLTNIPEKLMYIRMHRTNSPEYYAKQQDSRERFVKDYFKSVLDIYIEGELPPTCDLLEMMEEKSRGNFVDLEKIRQYMRETCPSDM